MSSKSPLAVHFAHLPLFVGFRDNVAVMLFPSMVHGAISSLHAATLSTPVRCGISRSTAKNPQRPCGSWVFMRKVGWPAVWFPMEGFPSAGWDHAP